MSIRTLLLLLLLATTATPIPAQTAKRRTTGRTTGKSPSSLTTYMPKVKAALSARWASTVTPRMSEFTPGELEVAFKLDASGKVADVAVKSNTSNEPFAKFCDGYVRETKFAAPPKGALRDGLVEIPFTFTIL